MGRFHATSGRGGCSRPLSKVLDNNQILALIALNRDQFEYVLNAANLLVVDKDLIEEFAFGQSALFNKINLRQIEALLQRFVPDKVLSPKPVPPSVMSRIHNAVTDNRTYILRLTPPNFTV